MVESRQSYCHKHRVPFLGHPVGACDMAQKTGFQTKLAYQLRHFIQSQKRVPRKSRHSIQKMYCLSRDRVMD